MTELTSWLERRPLRRLILNGGTIVFSILLAFWIDAWWADVVEARQEHRALLRLQTEFALDRQQLRDAVSGHESIRAATVQLLSHTGPGGAQTDEAEVTQLLTHFSRWITYNPSRGALESLLASGELDLIKNDSLRLELAAWPSVVEDLNEDEQVDMAQVVDHVIPFLEEHYSYRAIVAARDSAAIQPGAFPHPTQELLGDRRFEGILAARLWRTTRILAEASEVDTAILRIVALIAGELGGEVK